MKLTTIPQLARNANRVREILTILSKYGLADWSSRLGLHFVGSVFKDAGGHRLGDISHEMRIRLALTDLGTTFIKFGQILSTRDDLIGPELAKELTALQADAPADPPDVARGMVEKELGRPIKEVLGEFEDQPLASASIGQVHRARLRDGQPVVVKVQHPGIEARIRTDLDILSGLAELAERHIPEIRNYRPRATVAEFQRVLVRELDFRREERNLKQFANNFRKDKGVRFPVPCSELCTRRLLTMELLEGARLTEPGRLEQEGYDLEDVARRGAGVFLDMVFRDGFYHADPHPGNILVLPGGIIGTLDCGMVGRLDETTRERIGEMLLAIANRDAEHLTMSITRVGLLPPDFDQAGLNTDIADLVSFYSSQALAQFDLGGALDELTAIIRRHQVVLPSNLAMLIKVLVMLEGTGSLLSPKFNLTEVIEPYCRRLIRRQLGPTRQVQKLWHLYREWQYVGEILPRGIIEILRQVQTGRIGVHLEHQNLEPSVNRLVFGVMSSALFLGSALMLTHNVPPLLGGISIVGAAGCIVSAFLGVRPLWAIRKSGHLDRRP